MSRIATNVSALNTWRNLSLTNSALSKSLERLSSGYRINRAADDAAGLSISEKMRAQIRGLNMAVKNSQDGISLIQTAEGALNEYHAILQRMRELSLQAANRIQTPEDLGAIQDELNQLIEEANRIATTTEFNKQKLFDGTFTGRSLQVGANAFQTIGLEMESVLVKDVGASWGDGTAKDVASYTFSGDLTINGVTVDLTGAQSMSEVIERINLQSSLTGVTASQVEKTQVDLGEYAAPAAGTTQTLTINGIVISVDDTVADANDLADRINQVSTKTGVTASVDGANLVLTDESGNTIEVAQSDPALLDGLGLDDGAGTITADSNTHVFEAGLRLATEPGGSIVIGDNDATDPADAAWIGIQTGALTMETHTVATVDVSTEDAAQKSALAIDFALGQISDLRSGLGALQNRLEHTINNLNVAAENLSAAESRIRDVDMALEMSNFTKHQILLQAGTAMLAQANAAPQSVLQLLG